MFCYKLMVPERFSKSENRSFSFDGMQFPLRFGLLGSNLLKMLISDVDHKRTESALCHSNAGTQKSEQSASDHRLRKRNLASSTQACEMHVCEGFFITSFMNAVQFVHSSDREQPVASLGAHRQRPTTTRQSEDDFTSAQPPQRV